MRFDTRLTQAIKWYATNTKYTKDILCDTLSGWFRIGAKQDYEGIVEMFIFLYQMLSKV